jgi:nucleoside-diphosphate-sugar epimerase
MARILVTGGAGFIGSHLTAELVAEGHAVRVLDDFSTGLRENLGGLEIELFEGDVRDPELIARALHGVRYVFHQAALVSVPKSLEDPILCYDINVMGALNLLAKAAEAGVERVVLASSAAVYATSTDPVSETDRPAPLSPYAASKLAMEECARMYTRAYGMATVCLRYFNVYGPRQSPNSPYAAVIPTFVEAYQRGEHPVIFGDGEQRRDFVYVHDVVHANLLAMKSPDAAGLVVNIGSGTAITINQLAAVLGDLIPGAAGPVSGPPRPGDVRFSQSKIALASRLLDFKPHTGLRQGLSETVEWFMSATPHE